MQAEEDLHATNNKKDQKR